MLDQIPERVAFIKDFDFAFLRERFRKKYPKHRRRFGECTQELKRLFELMLYAEEPIEITSYAVDDLLFEFIAHDTEYRHFCQEVYGEYLRRVPAPPGYAWGGEHAQTFCALYEAHFGPVPDIWHEDAPVYTD